MLCISMQGFDPTDHIGYAVTNSTFEFENVILKFFSDLKYYNALCWLHFRTLEAYISG